VLNNRLLSIGYILLWLAIPTLNQADGLPPLTHQLSAMAKARVAPSLRFQNMDEEMVDLKDLTEQVVLVNFWATWCPPCRREMASLERFYQANKDNKITVLAVNIGEDIDTVFSFMGLVDPTPNFPVLFDTDGISMTDWKVRGLPTTYVVDTQGKLVYKAVGGREFDHPELMKKVNSLHK